MRHNSPVFPAVIGDHSMSQELGRLTGESNAPCSREGETTTGLSPYRCCSDALIVPASTPHGPRRSVGDFGDGSRWRSQALESARWPPEPSPAVTFRPKASRVRLKACATGSSTSVRCAINSADELDMCTSAIHRIGNAKPLRTTFVQRSDD